jgi:4-guanidinobutyraldehyde dehydrogenase/NAD-dependent aldehyde dehydrogenase
MATENIDWHDRASTFKPRRQLFIDGRWLDAASGASFDCISPIDGRVLAAVAAGDAADVDVAVRSARAAFDRGDWSRTPPKHRKKVLLRFAELIRANREELALTETLDMGKPISDSLAVDIPSTANCIQWYAEAVDKIYDEVAPTGPDTLALVTREPLGVVGAIIPWNFPLIMAAWKLGPVLAAGNSIVLKPSEKSPLSALRIAELAIEAGLPPGVFNVVPGFGHTAGKALASHMDVDGIAFTGSTATGKLIMGYAAQSNLKRVSLECGGKSPNVVMADYKDVERAARAAAFAIFFNQGEMCSAGSRLIVHETLKDAMLEQVAKVGRELAPGDPLDAATRMGAIVDAQQMQRVLGYIEAGRADGARVALGGAQVRRDSGGSYIEPTVFDGVKPGMRIAREEIFGPVLATLTFRDEAEALALANDSSYGLAAAVWTRDIKKGLNTAKALRAGIVWINDSQPAPTETPWGGYKQSGIGRELGREGLDDYLEAKHIYVNLVE